MFQRDDMDSNYLTVSELNSYLKLKIEDDRLLWEVNVKGEVTGVRIHKRNCYFTLKDELAQLQMICFNGVVCDIPKEGDYVLVTGRVSFYEKNGNISFIVKKIEPFGKGKINQNIELLREQLFKEGLFDAKRKKTPPILPRKIGVITSKDGAVIQDIYSTIRKSNSFIDVYAINVSVQGTSAVKEITYALKKADDSNMFDVIILARGGGSAEDLIAFNTEDVVRALANLKTFSISAIGHETDNTLCDYVADERCLTPTAAGEFVSRLSNNTVELVYSSLLNIDTYLNNLILKYNHKIYVRSKDLIFSYHNRIDNYANRIIQASSSMGTKADKKLSLIETALTSTISTLKAIDPNKLFENGYFKIMKDNKNINTVKTLNAQDDIKIFGKDGVAYATINKTIVKQ
jgi:exodeoxyribonuclease VII large subunit